MKHSVDKPVVLTSLDAIDLSVKIQTVSCSGTHPNQLLDILPMAKSWLTSLLIPMI